MARNELGSLRRSQAITTYGPGAIVDFRSGLKGGTVSVVAAGLDEWDERSTKPGLGHDQVINEPRLERELGVGGFRLPPVTPEVAPGVPQKNADMLVGVRFPEWLQCPSCHILRYASEWDHDPGDPARYCGRCSDGQKSYVVPVRFIMACERGHLDEFPWHFWVQHEDGCENRKGLKLKGDEVAGLAGLKLSCPQCGAKRSMEGCFSPGVQTCRGRRPWLRTNDTICAETPRVAQRGASNLYFSMIESALDIPPWSDPMQKKLQADQHWNKLLELPTAEKRAMYVDMFELVEKLETSKERILARVALFLQREQNPTTAILRWEEYCQFVKHQAAYGAQTEFELRPENVPPELAPWIERIAVATRLREVRAITGFTRIKPPQGGKDPRRAEIQVHQRNWLPGIEVRGEGIFLQLSSEPLARWEAQDEVKRRAKRVHEAYAARARGPAREVTARFMLVHSFAHALIRQLSLTCGYASASLRERIYVGHDETDMAGLLIYTASADADGTLGGLARQGQAAELARTVEAGLRGLEWCSSDPLCIEARQAASHQLNLAACHACLLASETSCEEFNYLLDRAMLIGTPEDPSIGFFRDLLTTGSERHR